METLIILVLILVLAMVLCFIFKFVYYWWYPTRSVVATIANAELRNQILAAGLDGHHGTDGILSTQAHDGIHGADGHVGEIGYSGKKSLILGATGFRGQSGTLGPQGCAGTSGIPGLPSNSLVPYVLKKTESDLDKNSNIFENYFSYEGVLHKLTGSFLFDEISHFAFPNDEKNRKYKIDTSVGYSPIADGVAKKIYSTIRIVLERKNSSSDGTVFYVSPPINRDSYIIQSDVNLNDTLSNIYKMDEINIDTNREFGLDFEIEKTSGTSDIKYNFMVGGLIRYRCIFNIEPPITNFVPRIEERLSDALITESAIPTIDLPAKGNIIKHKKGENIYMLSPRLEMGKVVYKNSGDIKNQWVVQPYKTLEESLDSDFPDIIKAFNDLENDAINFDGSGRNTRTVLAISKDISSEIYSNILFYLVENPPNFGANDELIEMSKITLDTAQTNFYDAVEDNRMYFNDRSDAQDVLDAAEAAFALTPTDPGAIAVQIAAQMDYDAKNTLWLSSNAPLAIAQAAFNSEIDDYDAKLETVNADVSGDVTLFSTRMEFSNLNLTYSNNISNLTFPSPLERSMFFVKFLVRIHKKDFIKTRFDAFFENIPPVIDYTSKITFDKNDKLGLITRNIITPESLDVDLPINFIADYIYHPVQINFDNGLEFKKFLGKRVLFNFSRCNVDLSSRNGDPSNFGITPDTYMDVNTRFKNGPSPRTSRAFNQPLTNNAASGFDFRFSADKFDIEGDTFLIGYQLTEGSDPVFQRVPGFRQNNGDYFLDVPPSGY